VCVAFRHPYAVMVRQLTYRCQVYPLHCEAGGKAVSEVMEAKILDLRSSHRWNEYPIHEIVRVERENSVAGARVVVGARFEGRDQKRTDRLGDRQAVLSRPLLGLGRS
jgi:hypothetical protein